MVHTAVALALVQPNHVATKGLSTLKMAVATLSDPKQAKYGEKLVSYMEKTWIYGQHPIATWNFFEHKGQLTNNNARELIKNTTGANLKCPDCKILSQRRWFGQP